MTGGCKERQSDGASFTARWVMRGKKKAENAGETGYWERKKDEMRDKL